MKYNMCCRAGVVFCLIGALGLSAGIFPGDPMEISGTELRDEMISATGPVALEPGAAYRFQYRLDAEADRPATVVSCCGPAAQALELDAGEHLRQLRFRVPAGSGNTGEAAVGIYAGSGKFTFRDFVLEKVLPVWGRVGGMELGTNEILDGNHYVAVGSGWDGESLFRFVREPAEASSYWWVIKPGLPLVCHFNLAGRAFTSGRLTGWGWGWNNAVLTVSISTDGEHYRTLEQYTQEHVEDITLDAELFPAVDLLVKYEVTPADPARGASIHLSSNKFEAEVTGPELIAAGERSLAVVSREEQSTLALSQFGTGAVGVTAAGEVRNLSGEAVAYTPTLKLTYADGTAIGITGETQRLAPRGTCAFALELPYGRGPAGDAVIELEWQPNGPTVRMDTFIAPLYDSRAGELLAATPDGAVWTLSSAWKVSEHRQVPESTGSAVQISAARDEFESRQLVISPKRDLRHFQIEFSDLHNADGARLAADCLEARYMAYLPVAAPSDSWGAAGMWPDPLVPMPAAGLSLASGRNHPLWLTLKTPADAASGTYTGTIALRADDYYQEVPIQVRVFDFTLPERMTAVNNHGFGLEAVYDIHNMWNASDADKERLAAMYWELIRDMRMSVPWPAQQAKFKSEFPALTVDSDLSALQVKIDWSEWDKYMDLAYRKYRMNAFSVPYPVGFWAASTQVGPSQYPEWAPDTPQFRALTIAYMQEVEKHYQEKGWLDCAFTYAFDEPQPDLFPLARQVLGYMKEGAPGVRNFVTRGYIPELEDVVDIWCPTAGKLNFDRLREMQQRGAKLWWYMCGYPKAPCPSDNIDHPAVDMRVWLWSTWREGLDGVMLWGSNHWGSADQYKSAENNPWAKCAVRDVVNNTWSNGDGRTIYPPLRAVDPAVTEPILEPPVPTLRLAMLRDGVEDYEYFVILKKLLAEKRGSLDAETAARYEALLQVDPQIVTTLDHYNWDPAFLEAQRLAVAVAIEELQKIPQEQ